MSLTLAHAFVAPNADGPDATEIQPQRDWNAAHVLAGATAGDLLVASAATTLAAVSAVAVGQVLVSAGVGVLPVWSASPTITSIACGTNPAAAGAVRIANNMYVSWRSVSNLDDQPVILVDSNNNFILGNVNNANVMCLQAARVCFNGGSNTFPALKRNAATLDVRLADDSGYAGVNMGDLSCNGGQGITVAAANLIFWSGRSVMKSGTDGTITVTNNAQTDFTRLCLGGTTSSFPALERSGTALRAVLADASGPANLAALSFTLYNSGFTNLGFYTGGGGDGIHKVTDSAGTSFSRLCFGGTTSAFPSLKRSSAALQARLADDSAFASFISADLATQGIMVGPTGTPVAANAILFYRTYTDASNFDRLTIAVDSASEIGIFTAASGTGTQLDLLVGAAGILYLGSGNTKNWAISATGHITDQGTHDLTVGRHMIASSVRGTAVAFASRPGTPVEGMIVAITDSTTNVWGATITGGGANHVLAYYNGTNWTVIGK